MTYILNKQQKCLREKQTINEPFHGNYNSFTDYQEDMLHYHAHIRNLKSYPILPEQWEGYEDGAEVEEGEFEAPLKIMRRLKDGVQFTSCFAIPKQKQVSQSEPIDKNKIWALRKVVEHQDKRIKELEEALKDCILFIDTLKEHGITDWSGESKAKQALQNK